MKDGKINIAFVSHFPHYKMGGQRSMLSLIEHLDRNKFRPFVILPAEGELSQRLRETGCRINIIPLTSLKPKNARTVISNIFKIRNFIKTEKIDILHPDFERDVFVSGLAKLFTQTKMVWHVRLTRPESLDKINARLSDGIIGISEATKKRFHNVKNIDKKFIKIFNGVDCEKFKPPFDIVQLRNELGIPADKKIVLFVGQIKDSKGIADIIEAAAYLKEQNGFSLPLFYFVGDFASEKYEKFFFESVESSGLDDSITYIPQQEKIEKWFAAADILLLPSYEGSEGMGRVVFEAMACGTVPVGTDISGINEAISNDTGILVNEYAPQEIAEAISRIINNPGDYERFKKNGLKRAKEVFDIRIHARNVENFYLRLLKKSV
jgi:glycosyltransferase involved in cell wall biosynthesis